MDVLFYDSWLLVGDREHVLADTFPVTELIPSSSIKPRPIAPPTGFSCRFANGLRNGNCYQALDIPAGAVCSAKRVDEKEVNAMYAGRNRLVVESPGMFRVYDKENLRLIQQQLWLSKGSGVNVLDTKFYTLGDALREYDSDGQLVSETFIGGASQLQFHEATVVNGKIVISGYQTYLMMEDRRDETGFIRLFKTSDISAPKGSLNLCEVENEQTIAFFDDLKVIPIYLTDQIIQPTRHGVAVFSYGPKVERMIVGDFVPYYASAGLNSEIYMSAAIGDTNRLLAFTADGFSYFNVEIPKSVGEPECPPLVATDGKVYVVGREGVAAYDKSGKSIWQVALSSSGSTGVFAALFNDQLVVGCGNRLLAFKSDGKILFEVNDLEGEISTPLVALGKRRYAVGTTIGLYQLVVGK
jgi:outer membrane protein assembly factor BamB